MKKIISTSILVFVVFVCNAQVSVGPKIGINVMTVDTKVQGIDIKSYPGVGLQLGAVVNVEVIKYFSIRPELLYNTISCTSEGTIDLLGFTSIVKSDNFYRALSIPINFVGTLEAGKGKFNLFAAPQFTFALGGWVKTQTPVVVPIAGLIPGGAEYKIKPGKDDNSGSTIYVNPFHVGINVGGGYQLKSFLLTAQYTFGISNVVPHNEDPEREAERDDEYTTFKGFNIGLTYLFGGKKK